MGLHKNTGCELMGCPECANPTHNLIKRLKEWRTERGISLRQVEAITGISNAYLSQLETGKIKDVGYSLALKVEKLIGIRNAKDELIVLVDRIKEILNDEFK